MQYHIVGIAGSGMSAIAHLLLDQGHTISGSDLVANHLTAALAARGARVAVGHSPAHIAGADALLATAAVGSDHPEVAAAAATGIPRLKRADLWRAWSQQRPIVAVAGTHGKTTTTAMIAFVLQQAGLSPGFLIGSDVPDLGTAARWGAPAAPLVIEADEYDRAFLALTPGIAVVTNVEWDHPDIYPSAADYQQAFADFGRAAAWALITCGDLAHAHWSTPASSGGVPLLTYGLEPGNHYRAVLAAADASTPGQPTFAVARQAELPYIGTPPDDDATYQLALPGLHNVRNALAAIMVADAYGVDPEQSSAALHAFRGTARRFEYRGSVSGITVVDDYAHHPTEVRATLEAARRCYGARRIVAYVQPHTYSRTETLLDDWPRAFDAADLVLVGAIYAAREQDPDGSRARLVHRLVERIAAVHPAVQYVGNPTEAATAARRLLRPGDVLLTMGAGDGNQVGTAVLAAPATEYVHADHD